MNKSSSVLLQEVQNLLQQYDAMLAQPFALHIALKIEKRPWILHFYQDMKQELESIKTPEISFQSKQKKQSELQNGLRDLVFHIHGTYCLIHHCSTKKSPSWMKREPKQSFIHFLHIFFQKLQELDDKIMATAALVINKGIFQYQKDFQAYQAIQKQKPLPKNDYKKLHAVHKSLQSIIKFLQE